MRTSVQRAIDALDAFQLRVLEAIVLLATPEQPVALDEVAVLLSPLDPQPLADAVEHLFTVALAWGDARGIRPVPSVREAVGAYPAGLGRPALQLLRQVADVQLAPILRALGLPPAPQPAAAAAIAALLRDPERVAELIEACDPTEREVLDRLAEGPPLGRLRVRPGAEPPAAYRLLTRGLLLPVDAQTVELPREVGMALRPSPLGTVATQPPDIEVESRAPNDLDRLGTTAVLETLRLVEALGDLWTASPAAQLRSGGVGVRDLRRTARELGVDEGTVAVLAEVAAAAGLLNATHSVDPVYAPTEEFDVWRTREPATRWADLALAWLGMSRQPSLVGQRDERERVINLLGPDVDRGSIAALRERVLDLLTPLAPGSAPTDREQVLRRLAWAAPRRAATQRPVAAAVLTEADLLGVTAAGGLTGYTRTLRSGSRAVAQHVLSNALPAPVDHFLVQPDLTVVVPGPPNPALAAELSVSADLESSGGASVYRVTEASLRRALDSGRSADDLAAMFAQRSRTPVPQSLTYLIDDLARRHGALRSGTASSYLRCDDTALLARVLADRNAGALQLRALAPTVAVSAAPVARVLEVLRSAGYAPAAEAPDGAVIALGAEALRAPSRQAVRVVRPRGGTETPLGEVVKRIRSGDTLSALSARTPATVPPVPGVTSAATLEVLRAATRNEQRVLLGVAGSDGTSSRHALAPISVAGGFVRGYEAGQDGLVSFPLHRITAATLLVEE